MPRKHLLIIISIYLLVCLIYYLRTTQITYPGFPLDDSWIHQVFARNIATGHGFSFNPDQPVAGATAPLWTLLLALAWMIGGPIAGGIITGIICQFLAYVAIYKIALIITENRNLSLLTAILSIFCWQTIWGAMSGMEPGLYSALSLWGLYFYFKADRLSHIYSYISYLLFALAYLARPECALFIVFAGLRDLYEWLRSGTKEILPWIFKILIVALIVSPSLLFNLRTTGSLFPLTFAAKVKGRDLIDSLLDGNFKRALYALTVFPFFYLQYFYREILLVNPIIALVSIGGVFKLLLPGDSGDRLRSRKIMLALLFLLYIPLMGALSPKSTPSFQHFRYIANLLPILAFMGTFGLFGDKRALLNRYSKTIIILSALLIAAGAALVLASLLFPDSISPIVSRLKADALTSQSDRLYDIVTGVGLGTALMGIMVLIGYFVNTGASNLFLQKRIPRGILVAACIVLGGIITVKNADTYANNIRNINECDVEAGIFLGQIAREGDVAAVNDIGSLAYFSNMEIFDLLGLVNTELSLEMISNDALIFEYLNNNRRVDYLAIAPEWFSYLASRTDIFKPIKKLVTEKNTILAEDTIIIYKAEWPDSVTDNYQERE